MAKNQYVEKNNNSSKTRYFKTKKSSEVFEKKIKQEYSFVRSGLDFDKSYDGKGYFVLYADKK